ncbi:MAG TPA: hypothetical protein DDW52_16235 [Planctomycetaceae bacterium]|nr:hypothetical protein [Planctomycetaceae bacterium]
MIRAIVERKERHNRMQVVLDAQSWLTCCLTVVLAIGAVSSRRLAAETVLVKAETVHTVDGDVLSPGQVLIKDGKIAAVAGEITDAGDAKVIEVAALMPGIVNASSRAGLRGGGAEVSREVTPEFNTARAIDWRAREFAEARDQGVTTLQILPETQSVFSGFACVVKSAAESESRMVNPRRGVVIAVCSDPTSRNRSRSRPDSIYVRQPTNRMGVVWIIRSTLHRTQQGQASDALAPQTTEILSGVLDGTYPVLSVSRMDYDVRSALKLGETFGFVPTIYGGDEVYRMVDEFKASGAPLVYTALTTNASGRSLRGSEGSQLRWNVPGKLNEAGVNFCLGGENLLDQARFAVRFGLPRDAALEAITLRPAKIMSLEKRIGSISVGKDADLVGLSGDPLQPTTSVVWTMVGGNIYDKHRE